MSSSRFKPPKRYAAPPPPKRNKREALVRRVASMIVDRQTFEQAMDKYPPYMRDAWIAELRPYMKFDPTRLT